VEISWRRNFYTLWIAELVAIIGFQAIQPFLPYYIQEFDVADLAEALVWAGYMGTASGLAMAISSPVWGALADRFGRKAMVVRSMIGGGITVLFMAYAASLEQLLAARVLQGVLAGTVTACITLVSTTTPRPHLGFALGMMQGAFMLGASVGPLVGGPFIDHFGYFDCFLVSGVLVLLAGGAVQLWVREDFRRAPAEKAQKLRFFEDSVRLLRLRGFAIMLVSMTLIQFAFGVVMPVVPLFLQQLAGTDDIVSLAGLIFSIMGLVGAVSSAVMGRWSGRLGAKQTLLGGLLATVVLLLAQGLSTSVAMLAILKVLGALASGAIRPVANALIADIVSEQDRGKAFGIMSSATAFGWALGPAIGGYIGSEWGFRSVFLVTAALFALVAAWVWNAMKGLQLEEPERKSLRELFRWRARVQARRQERKALR
jgi:DHA1 family multidrug resistance protein-like MFS transporter